MSIIETEMIQRYYISIRQFDIVLYNYTFRRAFKLFLPLATTTDLKNMITYAKIRYFRCGNTVVDTHLIIEEGLTQVTNIWVTASKHRQ